MKSLLWPLFGAMFVVSIPANAAPQQPPAAADQAAKLAEAHAILDVMLPESRRDSMFAKLQSDLFAQMMPTRAGWMQDPGIKKIFDDFIAVAAARQRVVIKKHLPEQINAMASAYTRRFSLEELRDINAFAHTPSGRHYMSENLTLVGDPEVAKVNAEALADIRSVTQALTPELKKKVVDYLTAHPEIAAKIKAESKSD